MKNNFDLNQEQLDNLVNMAGKKMGKDPQKIKEQMQSGQLDGIFGSLSSQKQEQIRNLMQNPEAVNQFMQNPKVQQLLKGLMGK